jgi:hypothetical protein
MPVPNLNGVLEDADLMGKPLMSVGWTTLVNGRICEMVGLSVNPLGAGGTNLTIEFVVEG